MKKDQDKTKEQLVNELAELRRRVAELDASEVEHKQAEKIQSVSEEDYQRLFDIIPIGVTMLDMKGVILYCNPAVYSEGGYTEGEFTGKHFSKISSVRAKDIPTYIRVFNSIVRGKTSKPFEATYQRKDGITGWTELHIGLVRVGGKRRILVMQHDITERKKIEHALWKQKEDLQVIIDSSRASIWYKDKENNILKVNRAAAERMNMRVEDLEGKSARELFPEHADRYYQDDLNVLNSGKPELEIIEEMVLPSGEKRWVSTNKVPYKDNEGNITGLIAFVTDITEHKQAEERFRRLFEQSNDAVFIHDLEGKLLDVNSKACDMLGYDKDTLLKMPVPALHPEEELPASKKALQATMKTGSVRFESKFKKADGTIIDVDISSSLIGPEGGIVQGIARDITERKQAEEERNKLFDLSLHLLLIAGLDGYIKRINPGWTEVLGYTVEELIGTSFFELVHPDDRAATLAEMDKLSTGIVTLHFENRYRCKDGSYRLLAWSAVPHPETELVYAIAQDITERKQAEERVKDLAKFPDENPNPVLRVTKDGTILYANEASLPLLDAWKGHVSKPLPAPWHKFVLDVLSSGSIKTVEVELQDRILAITFTAVPETDYVNLYGMDITERKQAEEREKQLQQELILASRLATAGEMAAGIAHEINNPLTGVIGFSNLLMKKDIPEDIRKDVNIIYSGAQRIADITGRMLSYTRQRKPERTSVNVNDVIETTLAMRAYEMESSGIQVETRLDPDLPITTADAGQLQQVFLNIILNAETEMITAHGKGNLSIKTERIDNTIRVSFKDDGPGIPKKNLDKIFDPFFTTREVGQGAGLGLSVCHGIITQHRGKIYAQSRFGKGTTFFVELPVVTKAEQLKLAEVAPGEPERVSRARILVVDDDTIVQEFLNELLTEEGHDVEIVGNGEDALERIDSEEYDVILLDIKLPGMSGIELYKYMQKAVKSLARRVVFITGDVMSKDTMSFLSRTKAPYITKPFDAEQMKKEIDRIISQQS